MNIWAKSNRMPAEQASKLPCTIVLVGLMGAGKTCMGRKLAGSLAVPFVDADSEIEAAAACSIEDIFAQHGEAEFRAGERRVIARLLRQPPHVLATGGGAFMDPQTRKTIRNKAISIWIRADLELLLKRTARRDNRPLLKRGDPRQILSALIEQRYPIYAEADITVDSVDGPPDLTLAKLSKALGAFLAARYGAAATAGTAEAESAVR